MHVASSTVEAVEESSMCSGLVRSAFSEVLEDRCLSVSSPRVDYMKKLGKEILSQVAESEEKRKLFDDFSDELTASLEKICETGRSLKLYSAMRGRLWSGFHKAALSELPPVWNKLLSSLGIECKEHLLCQSVNQKLFETVMLKFFNSKSTDIGLLNSTRTMEEEVVLTVDEMNALRYVGGFVPYSLLKRFERHEKKYQQFFECLGDMAVVSETGGVDFLQYTKEWIGRVNRGGLFPLNNQTFTLFVEIEKQTRVLLTRHMHKSTSKNSEDFKENVISKIVDNEDVQFHWTLISQCIDKEEDATWLLFEIVKLYVTVRGFSIAATWLEQYKREEKLFTKKSVELRKKLAS